MDKETLKKLVDDHASTVSRFNTQKAYFNGTHVAINQPAPKSSPDNRVSVPFARRAVAMIKGYMSKPGSIKYTGDFYENTLKEIYEYNDEQLTTSNELEDALIYGRCFELHWMGENGMKNFYPIPASQSIPIYNSELRPKLIGFIWVRTVDGVQTATVYDDTYYQVWTFDKDWTQGDELPHGYGKVPVNIGMIDRDGRNFFDHVLGLIDLYDKLISEDLGNELQRHSNAILAMAERLDTETADDNGRTMVERMKELGLIDGLGDGDVKSKLAYITKDQPSDFISFSAQTIERLIYEMLMIVNPNDDTFAGSSGIAQAWKTFGMELACSSIEAYFLRFLYNRIYMIGGISESVGDDTEGTTEVQISMSRNTPVNLVELADIASKLKGLISDDSLIGLFPVEVVADKEQELERLGSGMELEG